MIKINLISEAPAAAATKKRKVPEVSLGAKQGDAILMIMLALFLVITGGWWYMLKSERDALDAERADKQRERDTLQEYIDRVEELESKREELKQKIDVINQLKQNQRGPVRIMDEVSRALPDLVWLDQLRLSGELLTLRGKAMDENAVANYISNLDASPFFQEPSLGEITRVGEGVFNFTLTVVFSYTPPEIEGSDDQAAG
jgi:type IV pilus assembly protein PilN